MKKILFFCIIVFFNSKAQTSWNLTGNSGTDPNTNFVGTNDNKSLVFRVSNEKIRINSSGRIVFQGVLGNSQIWDKNLILGGGSDIMGGSTNTIFGFGALSNNSNGSGNTAIGGNTMNMLSSGDFNVAIGLNAMRDAQNLQVNTAVGMNAMEFFKTGFGNVALGHAALNGADSPNTTGDFNVALGSSSLRYFRTGNKNVVVGSDSFVSLQDGSGNVGLGYGIFQNILSGNNNIFIGNMIQPYGNSPENQLNIGNWIVGNNGTIGIGTFTNQLPADGIAQDGEKYKLFVKDGIKTEKVKVDIAASNGWADYVFEKDYKLMPLNELDQFINKNGHLPEVPTTEEAIKNGIELKEMNILLLKKVEELTLHVIEQQKRIETLEKKIK